MHGFLLGEGIIRAAQDISMIRYCDGVDEDGANTYNVIHVASHPKFRNLSSRSAIS